MNYRLLLLILPIMACFGCSSLPPTKLDGFVGKYDMACLPEAIDMTQGLSKSDVKSQVIIFRTEKRQHAVCAYIYPPGSNRLYVWDNVNGSASVRAYWDDAQGIAQAFVNSLATGETVLEAWNP